MNSLNLKCIRIYFINFATEAHKNIPRKICNRLSTYYPEITFLFGTPSNCNCIIELDPSAKSTNFRSSVELIYNPYSIMGGVWRDMNYIVFLIEHLLGNSLQVKKLEYNVTINFHGEELKDMKNHYYLEKYLMTVHSHCIFDIYYINVIDPNSKVERKFQINNGFYKLVIPTNTNINDVISFINNSIYNIH